MRDLRGYLSSRLHLLKASLSFELSYDKEIMFLTGSAIKQALTEGEIHIKPFTEKHLSPNSIDVTLNHKLLSYNLENGYLDMKRDNPTQQIIIPPEGFILQPNVLYIGSTNETATSHKYIPMFEGRSSIGRLGINTHITAGFGDVGWGYQLDEHADKGQPDVKCLYPTWTLEICVVHPVKVYPDVRIGQVYFVEPKGDIEFYKGKYSSQQSPQASKSYLDF